MKTLRSHLSPATKQFIKNVGRMTIGRLPPPTSRLTGKLAKDGGTPVRDVRVRPWPTYYSSNSIDWFRHVAPRMRRMFLRGAEGLPQTAVTEFAKAWADYCEVHHALVLPHGTDALRLGLAAALDHDGLSYGGEVIVPNLTFIATASAALDRRLGVVLVDVDPQTLNIDPNRIEEAIILGKTRAIMPVHLFGQPADMAQITELARKHSLKIVEDAAQAHGAIHEMGRAGAIGDVGAFSFQSSKNLASGEGGALTTNDDAIFERAHKMHNAGRPLVGPRRWWHESLGWNCRASEYIGVVLLHRLRSLEKEQQIRHSRYQYLRTLLGEVSCVQPLSTGPGVIRHGVHMFVMRYRPESCGNLSTDDFQRAVVAEGIPVSRPYEGLTVSQQPAIQALLDRRSEYVRVMPTPVADQAAQEILHLPQEIFLGSAKDMEDVAAAFRKVQNHYATKSGLNLPKLASLPQDPVNILWQRSETGPPLTSFGAALSELVRWG